MIVDPRSHRERHDDAFPIASHDLFSDPTSVGNGRQPQHLGLVRLRFPTDMGKREIGRTLRTRREELGVTQRQVAEYADLALDTVY